MNWRLVRKTAVIHPSHNGACKADARLALAVRIYRGIVENMC
jgi:hypothetical protein